MQVPPRHPVRGMQTGAEDPEPRSIGILHPVVVADQVGLRPLARSLAAPPFGGDPLGPAAARTRCDTPRQRNRTGGSSGTGAITSISSGRRSRRIGRGAAGSADPGRLPDRQRRHTLHRAFRHMARVRRDAGHAVRRPGGCSAYRPRRPDDRLASGAATSASRVCGACSGATISASSAITSMPKPGSTVSSFSRSSLPR